MPCGVLGALEPLNCFVHITLDVSHTFLFFFFYDLYWNDLATLYNCPDKAAIEKNTRARVGARRSGEPFSMAGVYCFGHTQRVGLLFCSFWVVLALFLPPLFVSRNVLDINVGCTRTGVE